MQSSFVRQNLVTASAEQLRGVDTLKVSNTLIFVFINEKILVVTPLEVYKIEYYHRNYQFRFMNLRKAVEEGEIKSVSDLIDYCKLRPGKNSQMYGLELVTTKLERHI